MSWQASRIVVPCPRRPRISSSTCAASCTPSEAVGSSSSSSRGLRAIARATATSWRWPPDSERTLRVVSRIGIRRLPSSAAAASWDRTSDSRCRRRSRPSSRFDATSRLSQSARSCQTTDTPCRAAAAGLALTGRPPSEICPAVGAMSPAMQRTSVVLPAPFSPLARQPRPARSRGRSRRARAARRNRRQARTPTAAATTALTG